MKNVRRLKDRSGQSTIEFALTLVLLFGFSIFFIQLSVALSVGNYIHYATFMAARTLFAGHQDESRQIENAKSVLQVMVKNSINGRDRWPGIATGPEVGAEGAEVGVIDFGNELPKYEPHSRTTGWQQGVRYRFSSRLFWGPFRSSNVSDAMTLTSESFLGREPSAAECKLDLGERKDLSTGSVPIYDNGC